MTYRYRIGFDPPLPQLVAAFGLAAKELSDFSPLWKSVTDIASFGILKTLEGEGQPLGADWPEPTKRYASRKRLKHGRTPLRRTGALLNRYIEGGIILKSGPRFVVTGIEGEEARYGKALHAGRKPKGALVRGAQRAAHYPFAGWTDAMQSAYGRLLDEYVGDVLEQAVKRMRRGG